ncbi:heavy metal translocating P-type ATPase [Paenibacillus thiaminolyticus]|uniref:heavy metal translocating P-type ATPase n=1 Tax=Paenibacillus thiaminolyticus TaxID=49283 RepID=UPI003B97E8B4
MNSLANRSSGTWSRHTLHITGMNCAACAVRIEKALRRMEGTGGVSVNFAVGRASVQLDPARLQLRQVEDRVVQLGFGIRKDTDAGSYLGTDVKGLWLRFIASALLTLPLLWTMFSHYSLTSSVWIPELFFQPWFQLALATPVQFIIGMPFYFGAFHALRNRGANMDVLVALGTSSAYFYSHYLAMKAIQSPAAEGQHIPLYFETGSMIITVVCLGKLLEGMARQRTMHAMRGLQEMQADYVHVIRMQRETRIPIEEMRVGDQVVIRPGERIPVDGVIVRGHSAVDESMMTGEGMPADKSPGAQVMSGTMNLNGTLTVEAQRIGSDSTVAQLIRLMEDAQYSKPPIQRLADTIASYFVPVVVAIAGLTFAAWYALLQPGDFGHALGCAVSVLVIACPCAIGLATPISILVGSGRAAQRGILFKEGRFMEQLHQTDAVLLDKTGTLTEGRPELTDILPLGGHSARSLLRWAAAAEQPSEHPISRAIVAAAERQQLIVPEAKRFSRIPGCGIRAEVEGKRLFLGAYARLKPLGIRADGADAGVIAELEREGKTVIGIAVDNRLAGLLAIRDSLRPTSAEAVRQMKRLGLEVMMVTGDQRMTAEAIAREAGIGHITAGVLPQEKVEWMNRLQGKGQTVTMVGDGINDAPALAAADIGIAMGQGSDIAGEAADIHLLRGDLRAIPEAILISRRTMANIRQNLSFALIYNVIAIPFAVMGWLEPWMAGTAMALSSVSVVGNALRLQRLGRRKGAVS